MKYLEAAIIMSSWPGLILLTWLVKQSEPEQRPWNDQFVVTGTFLWILSMGTIITFLSIAEALR